MNVPVIIVAAAAVVAVGIGVAVKYRRKNSIQPPKRKAAGESCSFLKQKIAAVPNEVLTRLALRYLVISATVFPLAYISKISRTMAAPSGST